MRESKVQLEIDAAHCERAAEDLFVILFRQNRAFAARLEGGRFHSAVFRGLRALGMVLALVGVALTGALLVLGSPGWLAPPKLVYLPLFVAFFAAFYCLPRLVVVIKSWAEGVARRSCRRNAGRFVREARRRAPFVAEYEVVDGRLAYRRLGSDADRVVWQRDLRRYAARGLALRGANAVAVFRRATSLFPTIVILCDASDWIADTLDAAGVARADIDAGV